MASQLSQEQRAAILTTPLGENRLVLTRFDAGEGLSDLFEHRVEAISEEIVDLDTIIGKHCWVTLKTARRSRVFDGILTEAQWLGPRHEHQAYRLVLKPWLWMLSRTTDCRIFANLSVPDIIKEVFDGGGFSDFRQNLTESYAPLDYCVQYRETNLAFVSRLMEEWGIYYYFDHEPGKHTMVLADSKSSHRPVPGYDKVRFLAVTDADLVGEERIYRVAAQRRLRTGRVTLNDYDYLKPNANLLCDASASVGYPSDSEYYDYPGKYREADRGERFARVRLESEQAVDQRRHAAGDIPGLYPGGLFTLEKHPNDSENTQYLVVRATHAFVSQAYRSTEVGDEGGDTYYGNYELLPREYPFRAPILTEKPVIHGPQTAKVVGKPGEEIDVDKHGRITVQFHWDRNKTPSCPVRVAQVWAGKAWGGIYTPRVDQEVVVEFLEGDPDRPLVVGTVYNGNNGVPYELPSEKTVSGVKSDSSKDAEGFNEFVFDDKAGSELIRGHAQKDLAFKVLNDETWEIGNDSTTDVANDIKVDAGNTITITAGMKIELKVGSNTIVMDGTGIKVNGLMIKVQASTTLDLKGALVNIN